MKIGRNDPCPCGSGKKYKHCCLNRTPDKSDLSDMFFCNTEQSQYKYVFDSSKKIAAVFSKYKIHDIVTAVFCLNIWRPNRSALAQCYAMNKALCMCNKTGNVGIDTYDDFIALYKEIESYSISSPYDDVIIDDFGEVFINYHHKSFPVITGTGHQQVYAAIRCLIYTCDCLNKQPELAILLTYMERIISSLGPCNQAHKEEIIYELPSEDLWNSVKSLFCDSGFLQCAKDASCVFGKNEKQIEKTYFFESGETIYPLWNPGLLIDYYHSLNPDSTIFPKQAFLSLLNAMYSGSDDDLRNVSVLIAPVMLRENMTFVDIDVEFLTVVITKSSALVYVISDGSDKAEIEISRIEKKHKTESVQFAEPFRRSGNSGNQICAIHPESPIHFIKVFMYTDIDEGFSISTQESEYPACSLLDLFYLFGFAQAEDVVDFYDYQKKRNMLSFSFGGISNEFFLWLKNHHCLTEGAVMPNFLSVDYNETEWFVYNYFRETLSDFPFNNTEYFTDPLCWTVLEKDEVFSTVALKGNHYVSGYLKKLCPDISVFLAFSFQFFQQANSIWEMDTAQDVLTDLCRKLFVRYVNWIMTIDVFHGKVIHLLFVPENCFDEQFRNKCEGDFFTCSVSQATSTVSIRFSVNIEHLFEQLKRARDRSIENQMFLDLMKPFQADYPEQYNDLIKLLQADQNKKKTVSVNETKISFVFSPLSCNEQISDISLMRVKNELAEICKQLDLQPGEYHEKDAQVIIRQIQNKLIPVFETKVAEFDQMDLHRKLLDYYAFQLLEIHIQWDRYHSLNDLDQNVREEFEKETIKAREGNRNHKLTAEYLIETNLFVKHNEITKMISDSEYNYLLAFSYWLRELQEVSDICYHCPAADSYITIDQNYILDTYHENEDIEKNYEQNIQRKYASSDYSLRFDDEDKKYMDLAKVAFLDDTGIQYDLFLSMLRYLSMDLIKESGLEESNYYTILKTDIISGFMDGLEDTAITETDILNVLDFITLDPSKLKLYKETKQADFLPVWEREKRNDRFDVKPIIEIDDMCIYSPAATHQLLEMWRNGVCCWFPPYEIGMDNLIKVLEKWKKRYEDMMVQDIAALFRSAGFTTFPEIELCSRFPKEHFPQNLGDYDCFCFNEDKAEIWLIESKVFHKVGSIFEDMSLQTTVFFGKKYDEKFQRRIDYVTDNMEKIKKVFHLKNNSYKVIPYMVTNKLFYSRYKDIAFEIITYSELKDILSGI